MKTKYRIDRSKWRCGLAGPNALGMGDTLLLNNEGYMCCLGQIAKQDGVSTENLINSGEPMDLDGDGLEHLRYTPYHDYVSNTPLSNKAMDINDNQNSTPEQKEKQLIELFAKHNIELEFYGKGVPFREELENDEDSEMVDG